MGKSIAIAGKGGTGKTTLIGLILRWMAEHDMKPILAVDADANANLGEVLDQTIELNVPLSIPHGLYLASEMLAGLDYAHRKTDDAGLTD